jgi:MOSC domain-containing protein YiiM
MLAVGYRSIPELNAGLDHVRQSPVDVGTLELIVSRPSIDGREILDEGMLDAEVGLVGDNWLVRGNAHTPDGLAHPEGQITLMNARAAALLAGPMERWALAGDQLYIDLDLSTQQLSAGARLGLGGAVIEITPKPHRGCAKFADRFGADALRFVNTGIGLALNLRGRNARVVLPGTIRQGDEVRRLDGLG